MITNIVRHGDGWAVLLDPEVFRTWNTNPGDALQVHVYDETLIIAPAQGPDRRQKFAAALKATHRRFGGVLRELVE